MVKKQKFAQNTLELLNIMVKKYLEFIKESKESIDSICQKYGIRNYTINEDGSIDVEGDVDLSDEKLTKLPLKFRYVNGDFNCSNNQLTSLDGCPKTVGRDFDCDNNQLTNLEGAPQKMGGSFYCSNNQLTSLEGAPQKVGGFNCSNNQLTSLDGCPKTVGRDFDCENNQLTSLEGCPNYVKFNFYCSDNPLLVKLTNDILDIGGDFYLNITPLEVLWNDVLDENKKFLDYLNTQTWDNVFPSPKTVYEDYFLEGVEENNIDIPENWRELLEGDGWTII
jgi:hypothetical protein